MRLGGDRRPYPQHASSGLVRQDPSAAIIVLGARRLALTASGRRILAHATPSWERAQRRLRDRLGERQWLAQDLLATTAGAARPR